MADKGTTDAGLALNFQSGIMIDQDMLDDGQPQPGPTAAAMAGWVCAVKALGQARDVNGVDPYPGIGDRKVQACRIFKPAQRNVAALRGVFDRVKYQI